MCNVMAKGFRFMPLGLIWCKLDAGVNTRGGGDVSLRDVTTVRDEMGDGERMTSRPGSTRRFWGNLRES